MTLIIFSIMLLNVQEDDLPKEENIVGKAGSTLFLTLPIIYVLFKAFMTIKNGAFPMVNEDFGNINTIGMHLFTTYTFPFEVVSILLLIGLLGVVVLAKRRI